MCTVPWRSSSAARQAPWSERVKTDAVSPYSVSFAISSASSRVAKVDDRRDRAEGLLLGDPHVAGDAVDDRRLVELPLVAAAENDGRTLGNRVVQVLLRAGQNLGRAHRPHVGLLVERVADAQGLRPLSERLDELVLHGLVDEDALGGRAALARRGRSSRRWRRRRPSRGWRRRGRSAARSRPARALGS